MYKALYHLLLLGMVLYAKLMKIWIIFCSLILRYDFSFRPLGRGVRNPPPPVSWI